jgi:NAD(P)-dependent dehydrogenase (short-subunit alcohol dehydrogenase family)
MDQRESGQGPSSNGNEVEQSVQVKPSYADRGMPYPYSPTVVVTATVGGFGRAVLGRFAARGAHLIAADVDRDALAAIYAIVTGGGRGIGRGITERFLEEGANVTIAQRHEPSEPFTHPACSFVPTDLLSSTQIAALMRLISDRFGALHILANNAGIMFEKTVEDMSEADWDSMMNVNLKAPFLLTKYAVPLMRNAGGGSIINIDSIEGLASNPGHPAYSASRAGCMYGGRDCRRSWPGWYPLQRYCAGMDPLGSE